MLTENEAHVCVLYFFFPPLSLVVGKIGKFHTEFAFPYLKSLFVIIMFTGNGAWRIIRVSQNQVCYVFM